MRANEQPPYGPLAPQVARGCSDNSATSRGYGSGGSRSGGSLAEEEGMAISPVSAGSSSEAVAAAKETEEGKADCALDVAPDDSSASEQSGDSSDEPVPRDDDNLMHRIFTVAVAGTGFLADSYDLFVINLVLLFMKENKDYGVLTPQVQAHVSMMAILGALTGQIIFGILGDQYGRRGTFIVTAGFTIVGNILQATAQPMARFNIYSQMMLYRFIMGLGVGGEYPAASTITSENSSPMQRGRNLAAVFSMQGFGRLLCALVLLMCAYCIDDPDIRWRVAILVGAVPMLAAICFRWLPETEAYKRHVQQRYPCMKARFKNIWRTVWANRKRLAGTAGSWFLLDVLFYGNSLFSADVIRTMGFGASIKGIALANLLVQLMALPGYILAVFFIDRIGRKRLQLFGFAGEAIIFGYMAVNQLKLKAHPGAFVFMYALTFLFDNFGANTTTFVIPAEIYPTEARATCHGISAAFGKAGAALGAAVFLRLINSQCPHNMCTKDSPPEDVDRGVKLVFFWCFVLAIVGFTWTSVLVRDRPHRSLELAFPVKDGKQEESRATAVA